MVFDRIAGVAYSAADGTGWREQTIVVRVQSDAALKGLGVISIPYAAMLEHPAIEYVRVRHPDGTVTETNVADVQEVPTPVTRAAPFYSDQRALELPVRNLRIGDTLEYRERTTRTVALAPGQFWGSIRFLDRAVVLDGSFEPARARGHVRECVDAFRQAGGTKDYGRR